MRVRTGLIIAALMFLAWLLFVPAYHPVDGTTEQVLHDMGYTQ